MFGYKVRVIWNKQKQILRRRMRGKTEKARWEGRMKELSSLKGTLVSLLDGSKCWFLARQRAARPRKGGWWQGRRLKFELWNKTELQGKRVPTIYISVLEIYSRVWRLLVMNLYEETKKNKHGSDFSIKWVSLCTCFVAVGAKLRMVGCRSSWTHVVFGWWCWDVSKLSALYFS